MKEFRAAREFPFRAEHVGSLLRPRALLEVRRRFAQREIDPATLRAAEDRAIEAAVLLQERVGLRLATDGEFRRQSYHSYFYGQLGDISFEAPPEDSAGGRGAQPMAAIKSRIEWKGPIHAGDFSFLRARTRALPKITIPGPCALHFRGGDAAILAHAYRDIDAFWDDIVAAFRSELRSLSAAGCRYVQIDETAFAKFGDADVQATLRARGDEPDALIETYIDVTNRVLLELPDISVGMHLCRGNRGGQWHAEGSYEAVADKLFNKLNIGFFFLEYDSERAGDFAPLRFVPRDKAIVLGLVSTKMNFLEDKSELKRRLDEASRFVPLDRLAVSPQCGFASTEMGNPISPEMQEAKLRLVVELARETWGTA
jgi:5-methyltetrahydropteroyltriglutamate--homocysteine methyltransferase